MGVCRFCWIFYLKDHVICRLSSLFSPFNLGVFIFFFLSYFTCYIQPPLQCKTLKIRVIIVILFEILGETIQSFTIKYDISFRVVCFICYQIGKLPSIFSLLRGLFVFVFFCLIRNRCLCQMLFLHVLIWSYFLFL